MMKTKQCLLTFFIDPGRRAYVRRINFTGNTKTEDEVLRREMRQMEGASADTRKIEQSKVRLERLGYFRDVKVDTVPVTGTSDQIDVNYAVEEQPSGSLTASLGYSQSDGLLLGGSINQNNFLGTGNKVSVALNKSNTSQLYNFGFTDPYYTIDGVSRGVNVHYRKNNYKNTDISNYSADSWGGDVSFGYPLSDSQRVQFSLGVDGTNLRKGTTTSKVVSDFLEKEGTDYTNFKATLSWSESELNRGQLPTRGYSQNFFGDGFYTRFNA